jgi:Tfp pilus assembly protein PilN
VIESYGDLESQARAVQKKIDAYNQVEQQTNIADAFPALSEVTPNDVKLDELLIKPDKVSFSGSTKSNVSLNLLINNLQLSGKFHDVAVTTIETGDAKNPGFSFRIEAGLKNNGQS